MGGRKAGTRRPPVVIPREEHPWHTGAGALAGMEDYLVLGRVGEGAHGIVMKCRHKASGQVVALKKVPLKRLEDGISEATIREIKALQQLHSQFVVKYVQ